MLIKSNLKSSLNSNSHGTIGQNNSGKKKELIEVSSNLSSCELQLNCQNCEPKQKVERRKKKVKDSSKVKM